MDATTLQWLNLAVNTVGAGALMFGAVSLGKILRTIEIHSQQLEENQEEHTEMWRRIWEMHK